jgi:uncharacterized protein YjbI with pentapeptide repeats
VEGEKEARLGEYSMQEILKLIEENGGPDGLDLSGKDLSDIDLSERAIKAELEKFRERVPGEMPVWYSELLGGANLAGANLERVNLTHADLRSAILAHTNLQEAILCYADLIGTILVGADLKGADLEGANLRWAGLINADLRGAYLEEAALDHALLEGADLRGAYLEGAALDKASLKDADLRGAHYRPSILQGADLAGAKRDWQTTPITEGMLEVAFALTGITSALAGVFATMGSFGPSLTVVLLLVISLSAAGSLTLYYTYLNQRGLSLDLRSVAFNPYGWLLLSSGGIWVFAIILILQKTLTHGC